MLTLTERLIDIALKESCCTMLSPQSKYTRDESGIASGSIDWSEENYNKLEESISQRMQALYKQSLTETLTNSLITYIDCNQKGEKDILLFIIEHISKQKNTQANVVHILQTLNRQSIIQEEGYWKQFQQENNISIDQLREIYFKEYKSNIADKDQKYIDRLHEAEYDRIMEVLASILENEKTKDLYLYLNNISRLSVDEKSRINNILYTRGSIYKNKYIRLKINNGKKERRTYGTNTGKRVQSTHDYSETSIREEDIL